MEILVEIDSRGEKERDIETKSGKIQRETEGQKGRWKDN